MEFLSFDSQHTHTPLKGRQSGIYAPTAASDLPKYFEKKYEPTFSNFILSNEYIPPQFKIGSHSISDNFENECTLLKLFH